jgi:hypothetical protein
MQFCFLCGDKHLSNFKKGVDGSIPIKSNASTYSWSLASRSGYVFARASAAWTPPSMISAALDGSETARAI